jgi:hypothetical protein
MIHPSAQQFTLPPGMMSLPSVLSASSAMMRRNFKQQGNVLPSSLHAHQVQAILAEIQARPHMFSPPMHQFNPSLSNHILRLGAMQGKPASSAAPCPSHWLGQNLIAAGMDRQKGSFQSAVEATSVKAVSAAPTKKSKKIPTSSYSNGSKEEQDITIARDMIVLVDETRACDVLCGRGGRSNHHPGNKRYRQVVKEMKASYKNIGSKAAKTDLSRAIVDHVFNYGGRFLKKMDGENGKYQVLSVIESRKKTSQALREAKDVKWTVVYDS